MKLIKKILKFLLKLFLKSVHIFFTAFSGLSESIGYIFFLFFFFGISTETNENIALSMWNRSLIDNGIITTVLFIIILLFLGYSMKKYVNELGTLDFNLFNNKVKIEENNNNDFDQYCRSCKYFNKEPDNEFIEDYGRCLEERGEPTLDGSMIFFPDEMYCDYWTEITKDVTDENNYN